MVIPIFKNNELIGVLDIDSPELNYFSKEEGQLLQNVVKVLEEHIK
ncbi:GAF domain-containing protein [Bacillus massiliigorillae]